MNRISILIILALLGAAGVAGCGEQEQSALYKDGKYRGKPDSRPSDNAPPSGLPGWLEDLGLPIVGSAAFG